MPKIRIEATEKYPYFEKGHDDYTTEIELTDKEYNLFVRTFRDMETVQTMLGRKYLEANG